ncbi:MAG: ADP-ribosylglycohydrolase family protein [Gammaproteobacteria bacterium]|nr:ADP-ribosylglycohydrolase family protein [Gammaproteobacteria bacterium]
MSHPLEIDELACGAGVVGMTLCPGKRVPSYYGGHWERNLAADMRLVADWGATAVVTLMEGFELDQLGVGNLGNVVEAVELDWHHLPIPDMQVPDERFERGWTYTGHVLRSKLASGERVLLHCRGGLGRTGTIAARLAIELGAAPDAALRAVRVARPGTVETPLQEAYVRACRPSRADDAHAERVLGCLLGGAVGDALGYAVEFKTRREIQERYGSEGIRHPEFTRAGEAEVSDDTQMTLFTADGLLQILELAGHVDQGGMLDAVRDATLAWYGLQAGGNLPNDMRHGLGKYATVLAKSQAPGTTCMGACAAGATGTPEDPINDSKGCGGVMRVAPVGLIGELTPTQAFDLAARCAAQTHGHPSGYLSAGVLAAIVSGLCGGQDLDAALADAVGLAERWSGCDETVAAVRHAEVLAASHGGDHHEAVVQLGEGWVAEEALAIGLYSAMVAADFREAVRMASNHGGDSDSTASITGQILGAWKGLEGIPNAWIRRLDVLEALLDVAGRLIGRRASTNGSIRVTEGVDL